MPVTDAELSTLANSHDIITIGMKADEVRRSLHGTRTTFVRVMTVAAEPGSPLEIPADAGEVQIVGVPVSRVSAMERIREVVAAVRKVPVTGYSLADLEILAARERVTLRSLLEDLQSSGLELVAEAPLDRLQDPRRSIEEVNIAGLALGRLTVHEMSAVDTVTWCRQVAGLQRDVNVIRAFAPLPRRLNRLAPTTGYDDVRRVAFARLLVENVASIQVDWSLYGPKLAQVALTVGADDVDAVSPVDDNTQGRRRSPVEELRRNIKAAGQEPIERDGRFDVIVR